MKTYLLIGGNSGMGLETAKQLVESGARVLSASRSTDQLEALGIDCQPFDANTLDPLTLPDTLDGFVYFPGSIQLKPFHRLSASDFQADLSVNLLGAVHCLQQALPALKKSPSASVVLFSSVAVQTGLPFHASISAAKGAIEGLTKALAAELAPKVRVNAIAPSLTDTPLASSLLNSEEKKAASEKRHPLQAIGDPSEIAALCCFLLGENASFVSGQIIGVDGGMSSLRTL